MRNQFNFNPEESQEIMQKWIESHICENIISGYPEDKIVYVATIMKQTTDDKLIYEPCLADASLWPGHQNVIMASVDLVKAQKLIMELGMRQLILVPMLQKKFVELNNELNKTISEISAKLSEAYNALAPICKNTEVLHNNLFASVMCSNECIGVALDEAGNIISTESLEFKIDFEDFCSNGSPFIPDDEDEEYY